ncbi:hypothetical protein Acsp06_62810 [Actinomycetospora sp. NBRC 106375]|uniref:hypothetical protein n=1 Tax=Actinomycetospora sp. NBRC 106375 TaxID=3032207 RepID=UPI0024A4B350|nr:hypothetical protein [Actinomycetospora sp. NBRC 106375]GLZ50096.1 hypothetical protein Acsp06_62810 [Actinomycetospora sp. NBRC 106375]
MTSSGRGAVQLRDDLGTEELDRPHRVLVRHGTVRNLREEAVVPEQLLLAVELVGDLGGAAHNQVLVGTAGSVVLFPGQGTTGEFGHGGVAREEDVGGLLGGAGHEGVRRDGHGRASASCPARAAATR